MLTDTRQALLDAIRDNPDDDAPRLIYADWLDENGDPERARFIRLQCEYARLKSWMPAAVDLRWKWEELEALHGQRWRQELPTWTTHKAYYSRGFLDDATLTQERFRRDIVNMWKHETFSNLTFTNSGPKVGTLFQDPLMVRVRGLSYSGPSSDVLELYHLAESPQLNRLQRLELKLTPRGDFDRTLLNLLRRWRLPALRRFTLDASGCYYDSANAILEAFFEAPLMSTATDIELHTLRNNGSFAELCARHVAPNLESLALVMSRPTAPWLRSLVANPRLTHLRRLELHPDNAPPEVWQAFFASPIFRTVREVSVVNSAWTDATVAHLAAAPHAAALEHLSLWGCANLTDASAVSLASSSYLRQLQSLNISGTKITANGSARLRAALPTCYLMDGKA